MEFQTDFGRNSTCSNETTVFCEYNESQFVKKLDMILENKVMQKLEVQKTLGEDSYNSTKKRLKSGCRQVLTVQTIATV